MEWKTCPSPRQSLCGYALNVVQTLHNERVQHVAIIQMEPLLHDCLIYCHAHMNDIVKTSTNLACLSDALLTR